jgi:drug/metabolite transporter (DMT)-like permease
LLIAVIGKGSLRAAFSASAGALDTKRVGGGAASRYDGASTLDPGSIMSPTQVLQLTALSVLWGGAFLFVGLSVHEMPALTLVLVRVGLAALCLLPLLWVMGLSLPADWTAWQPFVVMSLLNNIIPFTLIVTGQKEIAAGLASVLNATTPLFSVLVAALVAREALGTNRIAGVVIGLAGVAVLVGPDAMFGQSASVFGMVCALGAALSYGFSALWGRRFRTTPPLVSATSQLIASTVMLIPVVALVDRPWTLALPSLVAIKAMVALAVLSTALAYILFFNIMKVSGALNAMLVTLLIPVSGILLGHVVLAEPLVGRHLVGAAIIIVALVAIDGRVLAWFRGARTA